MNLIKKSYISALAVIAAGVLTGCQEDELSIAKAVMASASTLTFDGLNPDEQVITVYSDAQWTADIPDWVTIEPTTGSGTTDVTVTVTTNLRDGSLDNPRKSNLVFHGSTLASRATVIVQQTGDKYRDVPEVEISQIPTLEDEAVILTKEVQAVALSSKGFIAADATGYVYVKSSDIPALGDNLLIWGEKDTDKSIAVILADKIQVNTNSAVTYPAAYDITGEIDSYKAERTEYIKASGLLNGTKVSIEGAEVMGLNVLDAHADLNLADLDGHNVEVEGFFVGTSAPVVNVIAANIIDHGAAKVTTLAKWHLGDADINFGTTFPAEGIVRSSGGEYGGYITYVPEDLENSNDNNKYKLDVSANNPRVSGPWPGDYWLFHSDTKVMAGDKVQIIFQSRVSGTGHKFWRLEYLDGKEWKTAGAELKTSEPGQEITYTHAMASDGSTNITVNTTVTYLSETSTCEFRFVCVANWQANGSGALDARNGGTARLSIDDATDESLQPSLTMLGGSGGMATNVIFFDDFSWLAPLVEAAQAADPGEYDTVGSGDISAKAPNLYTTADLSAMFITLRDKMGYVIPGASDGASNVVYLQDCYLKMGKTGSSSQTSLTIPPIDPQGKAFILSFDWARMVQGSGTIDNYTLTVMLTGNGTFEDGTKYQDFATTQDVGEIFWTNFEAKIIGADKDTKITFVATDLVNKETGAIDYTKSGGRRMFIDNIKAVLAE